MDGPGHIFRVPSWSDRRIRHLPPSCRGGGVPVHHDSVDGIWANPGNREWARYPLSLFVVCPSYPIHRVLVNWDPPILIFPRFYTCLAWWNPKLSPGTYIIIQGCVLYYCSQGRVSGLFRGNNLISCKTSRRPSYNPTSRAPDVPRINSPSWRPTGALLAPPPAPRPKSRGTGARPCASVPG